MPYLRRLLLFASVGAVFAVLAGPAFGGRADSLPFQLGSTHFLVHYQSDLLDPGNAPAAITETQAGDIAALAERAYAAELADGYPAPPSDGALGSDARIDIYVENFVASPGLLGMTEVDANPQKSAYIRLAGNDPAGLDQHTIAHELFHVLQFGIWQPAQLSDWWLLEGSAEWMAYRVDAYNAAAGLELGQPDMALDCRDQFGTNQCDLTGDYANNGYSRWPFFEYLGERYGYLFVKDVFAQGAAGAPSAMAALDNALKAKGTTLSDVFNDYSAFDAAGAYTVAALHGLVPSIYPLDPVSLKPLATPVGTITAALPIQRVTVNHLAARYLDFSRGGPGGGPCYAATLSLTVAVPAGSASKPSFFSKSLGTAAVPLTLNGSTASLSVPWDTCFGGADGYLALPNASLTAEAQDFVVSGSLTVDTTKPATAALPPTVLYTGPTIASPTSDVAPSIMLYGAELLRVPAATRIVRLIVFSSGPGQLRAAVGLTALGSATLRAGNNDLRFRLPASTIAGLRSTSALRAGASLLTLTSFSTQGSPGTTIARTLKLVVPPKAVKPKPAKPKTSASRS